MKRSLIITIGIVIILLILGLWVYLLVFGTPKTPRDVFANIGVLDPAQRETSTSTLPVGTPSQKETPTQLSLSGSQLQQLTTRSVAGFAFASSSDNTLRYVERGTGYVYEINLDSGIEKQITLTTIPQTIAAVFSRDASEVVFTSYTSEGTKQVLLGEIKDGSTEMTTTQLPNSAENIAFKNNQTIYFTQTTPTETIGYTFNVDTLKQTQLFALDVPDMQMRWGASLDAMYAQTKPTKYLEGYLYTISKGALIPVGQAGYGLTAFLNNTYSVISMIQNNSRYSAESLSNAGIEIQSIAMLPEKCVFSPTQTSSVWCAAPLVPSNADYVELWYKGILNSEDYLWSTDLEKGKSTVVADLQTLSSRSIDVSLLEINTQGTMLLFENKIDGTLWLYKIGK